jgi:hypothetical protein
MLERAVDVIAAGDLFYLPRVYRLAALALAVYDHRKQGHVTGFAIIENRAT